MIDEHELRALADYDGPTVAPRPTDAVAARGRRLSRRRRVRVAATTLAVAAVAALAVTLPGPGRDQPGDSPDPGPAAQDPDAADLPVPSSLIAASTGTAAETCGGGYAEAVEAGAVGDTLRLLPTWGPGDMAVTQTWGRSERSDCPSADPALVLRAVDGGLVTGVIKVEGPYSEPLPRYDGPQWDDTTLRGRPSVRMTLPFQPDPPFAAFTWTDADGASWWVEGSGVDEATLRGVAESLVLDGGADGPAAGLPDSAIPAGFDVTWQAPGRPTVEDATTSWWHASFRDDCTVSLRGTAQDAPVADVTGGPGSTLLQVRGHDAVAIPQGGTMLFWAEAPGIIGEVSCPVDVATAARIAESLEPVAPDDPRLRPLDG